MKSPLSFSDKSKRNQHWLFGVRTLIKTTVRVSIEIMGKLVFTGELRDMSRDFISLSIYVCWYLEIHRLKLFGTVFLGFLEAIVIKMAE